MKKLIQGIVDFKKNLTEENRALFAKLSLGQKPDTLFVACSDSRVVPNLFASTNPGDLFVVRNIGNLIPPLNANDKNISATIEYSIKSLNVSDIIICGHSECGAIESMLHKNSIIDSYLNSWLKYSQDSVGMVEKGYYTNPLVSKNNEISQANVLLQMNHLRDYPLVKEGLKKKKLRIHGWWFDIALANVYCFERQLNQFVLIDQNEANTILSKLN